MGPLHGFRVIEMAGIGPAPFCGMLLADMGADVLRIDRREPATDLGVDMGADPRFHVLSRGKRSVAIDVKHPAGRDTVLDLVERADALIEGFRPGTMERLQLSPEVCQARNPGLVYGRMTGWGQKGPAARTAGHDINYIALSGALHSIGTSSQPIPPLNLVGDFGGGAMFLAFGIVSALLERQRSGRGQVVDAAMVDGSAYLMASTYGMFARGIWSSERGENLLDGGAPWYTTYETQDNKFIAVGAVESRFYTELLHKLGLAEVDLPDQHDRAGWPVLRQHLASRFRSRTRDEWTEIFLESDACVAPVLSLGEVNAHPHNHVRGTFLDLDGVIQPSPAPRFERSVPEPPTSAPRTGQDTDAALLAWGLSPDRLDTLRADGAIGNPSSMGKT